MEAGYRRLAMVASDPRQGRRDVMEMVKQQRARELAQLGVPQEDKQQGLIEPEEVDEEWLKRKVHQDKQTFLKSSRELLDDGEGKNVCLDASDRIGCDEIAAAGRDNGDGGDGAARKLQRRKPRQRKRRGRRSRVDTELNPRVQRNHREVVHRALEDRGDVNEGSSRELLDDGEGKNVCLDASDRIGCDEIAAAGRDNGDGGDGAARKLQRRKPRQRKRRGRRSRVDTELNPRVQRNHREVVHRALEDRGDVNEGNQSQSNSTSANETTSVAASGSTNGMTSRVNDTTNVAPNSLEDGMSSRVNDTTSVAPDGSKFSMRSRVNDTTSVAPEGSKLSVRSGVNDTTNVAPQSWLTKSG